MRFTAFILIALLALSCKEEQRVPKDYAVVHGKITNANDSTRFRLYDPVSSKSLIIEVNEDGTYRDTLKLETPTTYNAVYGNVFPLYLANDMNVQVDFDATAINKTVAFKGRGEAENNFLKFKGKHVSGLFGDDYTKYLGLEAAEFDKTTKTFMNEFHAALDKDASKLDSTFVATEKTKIAKFKEDMTAQHKQQLEINAKLGPGKPSPDFKDYINYKGGTSSLDDFKGKYVYIDVWATWCVPCIYEIPFLKKVEKEFEGKNITFLSISADNLKDEGKWRKMIKEKDLHGVQLLADKAIESQFLVDYYIYGIPRFILLDPEGNVVNYDAPRPSMPELTELLNTLNL